MKKTFLIVADDFTGANDAGVQIAKYGIHTSVVLDEKGIKNDGNSYVLDTESRNIAGSDAYQKVKEQAEKIRDVPFDCIIKKVDSTIRGNIAEEIKALDEVYSPQLIIFAPAYPEIGRTTVAGRQMLHGIPIHETEISKDPIKPVYEDRLEQILKKQFSEPISVCQAEQLLDREDILTGRIWCCNISTEDDMKNVVHAVRKMNKRTLWVGSAGVVGALLNEMVSRKPILCVIGSISEMSRKQMTYCQSKGLDVVRIDMEKIIEGKAWRKWADETIDILKRGKDVIITTSFERADYERAVTAGEKKGISKEEVSSLTREILADFMIHVAREARLGGMFLTGGDTAIGFIKKSGAYGSVIEQEVATGVPLMKVRGGEFDSLPIITKAGAFGTENTIFHSIMKLKEKQKWDI